MQFWKSVAGFLPMELAMKSDELSVRAKAPLATRSWIGWAFIAPALFVISVFFFLPTLAALFMSATDYDLYALGDLRNLRFVAFENYAILLKDARFWQALGNTFYFVIGAV